MKIASLLALPFLAGCDSMVRMNDSSNAARVQVASWNAHAVVQAEQARTNAAIGVAQARAMADVSVNAMWAAQIPWVIGALCITVIVVAIIYWQGRVAVIPRPTPTVHILPERKPAMHPQYKAMQDFARANGGDIVWTPDGKPLLQVDGKRRQLRITARQS